MANRFSNFVPQDYVSTYVPLPLEAIGNILESKQRQYDINETERINLLDKQYNTLQQDRPLALKAKQEIDKSLEDFSNKDFSDPVVKQQWMKTKRDIANRFGPLGDIGAIQSNYNAHQEYMKGLKERLNKGPKEGGIDETTYNKLANISLARYQGIGEGSNQGYNQYQGITPAGYSDLADQADKLANNWKADSIKKGGYYDVDGRFIKKSTQEIEQINPNEIYKNILPQLMSDPMNQAFAKQQLMLKTYGKEISPDQLNQEYLSIFNKPAEFAANKYGYRKEINDQDWKESQEYLRNKDKKDLINSLTGQSIEGQTYNPIENDKNFQDLKDNGVFKLNNDGTVKIDWLALNQDTKAEIIQPTKSPLSIKGIDPRKPINIPASTANDKQKLLAKQMKKMADITGFKGELKTDNYELIASGYNILNKARLFGEQLSAPVSNLESSKLTRNWELSTAYDPENINKVTEKPTLTEDSKIIVNERQTNEKGEMIKKGIIVNKDGSRTPFAVKSNSLEDSGYFDNVGAIGVNSVKYQVGELPSKGKTQDGFDVIDSKEIPYVGTVVTVGNPRDKSQLQYRVVTDDGQRMPFNNYGDLQKFLETQYYTKTPEGRADAQELLSKDKQFKSFE